ncbi:hypothetical protein EAG_13295 [Camponotus floridanus]|uniref:Uncharacterized protein n=1 Tax=Camponotus floridanus TaxID=104421 RepID=E1ZWU0_CAMFO|nr:hypothetical protein EAG_13295 [Camponotus floridanus]
MKNLRSVIIALKQRHILHLPKRVITVNQMQPIPSATIVSAYLSTEWNVLF